MTLLAPNLFARYTASVSVEKPGFQPPATRMRPEKLDKITWFKEKGEPKELYYVIKYFSPRSKTKFSKRMKEYFENDYFGVDRYSRTAEDVSDDFKETLIDYALNRKYLKPAQVTE